jgi:squalene-hopene/tetraprenyl-beta-curcumene cyclase
MMLLLHDPAAVDSEAVAMGVEWILGMQNRGGGWAAFDTNNDAVWLHSIPFNDMQLIDPSTADVTGRILECFGMLLTRRKGGRHSAVALLDACRDRQRGRWHFFSNTRQQREHGGGVGASTTFTVRPTYFVVWQPSATTKRWQG